KYDELVEELLEQPYRVIDILPVQVPPEGASRFFAAEAYWLEPERLRTLYGRFAEVLVKLSCYADFTVYAGLQDIWLEHPQPGDLVTMVRDLVQDPAAFVNILVEGEGGKTALVTLTSGDLYMTLYAPWPELEMLVSQLAGIEGLFLR
ncbi:MAG: hypothetical protein IJG53_00085, partial [Eggerthellaceae bacterium]|nr:hypothetical protein [Eggerthellaceae bacterium]